MLKTAIKKFGHKRAAAVAILGLGAIGASHLPARHTELFSGRTQAIVDGEQSVVFGTNNLLGGISSDQEGAARAAEINQDHLISCMSLSQAGDSTLINELRGLTRTSDASRLAVAAIAGNSASTAAVPEPAAASVLGAMFVPALLRRRRSRGEASC